MYRCCLFAPVRLNLFSFDWFKFWSEITTVKTIYLPLPLGLNLIATLSYTSRGPIDHVPFFTIYLFFYIFPFLCNCKNRRPQPKQHPSSLIIMIICRLKFKHPHNMKIASSLFFFFFREGSQQRRLLSVFFIYSSLLNIPIKSPSVIAACGCITDEVEIAPIGVCFSWLGYVMIMI